MESEANTEKTAFTLPPAYELAMLAAAMNKGPEDALRLWWKSKLLLEPMEAETDEKVRREAIAFFTSNPGFLNIEQCFESERDCIRIPIGDAMKAIGVYSEKTLLKLYQKHFNDTLVSPNGSPKITDERLKAVAQAWRRNGVEMGVVSNLIKLRHEQNVQRGLRNRTSVTKGKRRTLSK